MDGYFVDHTVGAREVHVLEEAGVCDLSGAQQLFAHLRIEKLLVKHSSEWGK
jgi:hypothetical protein